MEIHHTQVSGPTISRLGDLMAHINRYQINGPARLARDIGVAHSTINRLLQGQINPSFSLAERITARLEIEVGHWIDPRDIFSGMGRYLTHHVCDLMRCRGCLPDAARDETFGIRKEYTGVRSGKWVSSLYPTGYPSNHHPNHHG